jgi:ABC-type cobalamin/Fe3+-siderophores transport system ATPase subunit
VSICARSVSFAYPSGRGLRGRGSSPAHQHLAVDGVSLEVPRGRRLGILGPNGSGKTTLLKLLGGVLSPSSGEVTLDGRSMRQLGRRAVARRIAMVPQDTHPAFDYTALELVLMGRHPHLGAFEVEDAGDIAIAEDALKATGTLDFMCRPFSTLSGGERQRVVIAAALAQQPELLLLDEPTASLDPGFQVEIAELLLRLHRERGLGFVLSTHDLNLAASLCDTLVLMQVRLKPDTTGDPRGVRLEADQTGNPGGVPLEADPIGSVIAAGPTREVLTPDNIAALYGIRAEVGFHEAAGHLVVVPFGRARR